MDPYQKNYATSPESILERIESVSQREMRIYLS